MINYISSWTEQIIICVVIVTILEMILPKGNSKKYIKTIIGIYVLYTIISPAIKLFTGSDLKLDYSEYEKYINSQEIATNITAPTVEDTYKAEIEKQMKSDIESVGYNVSKLKFNLSLDEGVISDVVLTISKEEKKEKNENTIAINKVEIGGKKQENILTEGEIKQIKQVIQENYGVDYNKITVNSK